MQEDSLDPFIHDVDLVTRLEQRLYAAIDDVDGWSDQGRSYLPGPDARNHLTRTVLHANGAGLRFHPQVQPHFSSSCTALLAEAVLQVRDGQGVVLVREGWIPFGSTGWSDADEIDLQKLVVMIRRHAGTRARAQQAWGEQALIHALHAEVPEASGEWLVRCPGLLAGNVGGTMVGFVRDPEIHTPDILSILNRNFRPHLPAAVQECRVLTPGLAAAMDALGAFLGMWLRMETDGGRTSGFAHRLGRRIHLGPTGHERLGRVEAAIAFLQACPICP